MALVKKLQAGGNIDPNALNEALNAELGTYNLKSKDERKVRDALVKIRDFSATPGNSFTADQVAQKFIITGPGSNQFQGSPDDVKTGWLTGKLKIKDDQDAMSVAAAIYAGAHKKIQPSQTTTSTTTPSKINLSIDNYDDYLVDKIYGGRENFQDGFKSLKTNQLRQQAYLDGMNELLTKYETSAKDPNNSNYTYSDLDKIAELRKALGDGSIANWDNVTKAAYRLGWKPGHILINDNEKQTFDAVDAAKKQEDAVAQTKLEIDRLQKLGLNPNISTRYLEAGYLPVDQLSPNGYDAEQIAAFNEYIKNKKGFMFQNPTGQQVAIDLTGQPIESTGSEFDQFNPLTGKAWKFDPNIGFVYGPGKYTASDEDNDDIDRGKMLESPDIRFKGKYGMIGYSRKDRNSEKHALLNGNRDYTKYIELRGPNGMITLSKDDKGNYIGNDGKNYGPIKISGYDTYIPETEDKTPTSNIKIDLYTIPTEFANIKPIQGQTKPLRDKLVEEALESLKKNNYDSNSIKLLIGSLKYAHNSTQDHNEKISILRQLGDLSELLKVRKITFKSGGIIKAQKGTKADMYIAKYSKPKQSTSANSSLENENTFLDKGGRGDIAGTWKSQSTLENALDATSIAGTAASLAPGWVGVGGASTVFAADLIKDLTDDKPFDSTTHAINAVFIGLSFVGLGATKALVKAGKIAKEGIEISKIGEKALKYKKALGFAETDVAAIKEVASFAKTHNLKSSEEILVKVASLKNSKNIAEVGKIEEVEKGLKLLSETASSQLPFWQTFRSMEGMKELASNAIVKPTIKAINNPWVSNAAKVGLAVPAVISAQKTFSTIRNNGNWDLENLQYTKPEDLKNIARGVSAGRNLYADYKGVRALNRQLIPNTEGIDKTVFKVGEESITLNQIIKKPTSSKLKTVKNWFKKSETIAKNDEAVLNNYKNQLLKSANAEKIQIKGKDIVLEDLKNIKSLDDVSLGMKTQTGKFMLPKYAQPITNNRFKDTRDYKLATKYWEKYGGKKSNIISNESSTNVTSNKPSTNITEKFIKEHNKQNFDKLQNYKRAIKKETKSKIESINPKNKPTTIANKIKKLKQEEIDKIKLLKDNIKFKKGGILKYQNAGESKNGVFNVTSAGPTYNVPAKGKNMLPYSTRDSVDSIFQGENYNKVWLPKVTTAFNDLNMVPKILNGLNNYKGQGEDVVKSLLSGKSGVEQLTLAKRLASDGNVGPFHYIMNNILNKVTTPITPTTEVKGNTPINVTPEGDKKAVDLLKQPSTDINSNVIQKPGLWAQLKGNLDSTGIANGLMSLNTLGANAWIGDEQRKAISAGLFQFPYMQHQYLRVDKPYSLAANKQAAEVNAQGKSIASSTSDLNQGNAIRLQALKQASGIIEKGQGLDWERLDKARNLQLENNASVDSYNTQTLGKNRGLTAEAMQKIHLTNANQHNAQNTATNNWLTAWDRNYGLNKYKQDMTKYFGLTKDPKLKSLSDEYTRFISDDGGKAEAKALYEKNKLAFETANPGNTNNASNPYSKPFEESQEYKNWEKEGKRLFDNIQLASEPLKKAQEDLNFQREVLYNWSGKSGGKLSKKDKMDIDNNKFNNTKRLKETELTYKAIMHNNEMLQKALIKVFK